jgi:hypothetical protein
MATEPKKSVREPGRLWDSLVARSNVYSDAVDRLVELGKYNKHTEQEVCVLLQRMGGEIKMDQEELDAMKDRSFTVMVEEDEEGNIVSKILKLK